MEEVRDQVKDALNELEMFLAMGFTKEEALHCFILQEDITEDEKEMIVKAFELGDK